MSSALSSRAYAFQRLSYGRLPFRHRATRASPRAAARLGHSASVGYRGANSKSAISTGESVKKWRFSAGLGRNSTERRMNAIKEILDRMDDALGGGFYPLAGIVIVLLLFSLL
jgi:hypothetical protein